jgi:hypothetical protein
VSGIGHFELIHTAEEEIKDGQYLDGPLSESTFEDVIG